MTDEKQDLDNLVKHPGWLRVVEHATKDIAARIKTAQANAANETNDIAALNKLRQCLAAEQALESFVAWPGTRLKALIASEEQRSTVPQLSRRGSL